MERHFDLAMSKKKFVRGKRSCCDGEKTQKEKD